VADRVFKETNPIRHIRLKTKNVGIYFIRFINNNWSERKKTYFYDIEENRSQWGPPLGLYAMDIK
jgi:hypothetical protein